MTIFGIDPGAGGAIAHLTPDGHWIVEDAPIIQTGKRKLMNAVLCAELLDFPHSQVFIERQQAMPGQGGSSTFQIGRNFGTWEGVAAGKGHVIALVTPRAWKTEFHIRGETQKEAARAEALRLFPYLAPELARKKDHGRAEAVLIGEFGRRTIARNGG